jgi:hypothetical protein
MLASLKINLIIATIIALISITIFYFIHPAIKIFFIPAMVIAYFFYLTKSYGREINTNSLLPVYLICIAIQLLHFTEEFIYGFHERLPDLMIGIPAEETNLFVSFNMIAYSFFILAAVGIYKKIEFLMIIVWFFAIAAVVFNVIGHLVYALRVGGYFPGLYTSLAYWVIGPVLLKRMFEVTQKKHL